MKNKSTNYTKQNISKIISTETGISNLYCSKIIDDLISILQRLIKEGDLNIKNFATFKTIIKKERLGRNPKTKEYHKISPRSSMSFLVSKKMREEINNI